MSELKEFSNLGAGSNYQFTHNGKEYVMWIWLDSDSGNEPMKACLGEPRPEGGGYVVFPLKTVLARPVEITSQGGVQAFVDRVFVPMVNRYLLENGGGNVDFPSDGEFYEKFNWIFENSLSYANGKVTYTA